ncbi:hypothetical protein EJB05_22506, partial [Eragrostis curvula]
MLIGFVFSHDKFSDGGVDEFGDELIHGSKFILFACGRSEFSSGIFVSDGDPRWWNLRHFQGFLSLINEVGVV